MKAGYEMRLVCNFHAAHRKGDLSALGLTSMKLHFPRAKLSSTRHQTSSKPTDRYEAVAVNGTQRLLR